MNRRKDEEENKEEFCAACLAVPIAMAGVGTSAYGANKKGAHKKTKKVALCFGLSITFISILVAIYFIYIKKCEECR